MKNQRDNSFVRQAAILATASIIVRLIGFLYRIPLTRLIGGSGNALYAMAYQVYTFAIVMSSGTFPAAVSRLVSARIAKGEYYNAHQMFKTAMVFALIVGAIAALFMGLGANHIALFLSSADQNNAEYNEIAAFVYSGSDRNDAALAIRALAPTVVFVAMLATLRGYFQGMKTALPTAVSQVAEQIFNVIFTVLLAYILFDAVNIRYSVAGAAAGTGIGVVAGLIVLLFLYALVAKDLRKRAIRDRHNRRESKGRQLSALLVTALPMIIGMGIFSVSSLIDIRMGNSRMLASGAFTSDEVRVLMGQFLGKFVLLTTLPVSLSMALSAAVIPEITASSVNMDTAAVRHKTNMALRLSMILSVPSAVGLAVLADPILLLLFPDLPGGGVLLRVGSVSIIFMALVHVPTGILQGLGHVRLPIIAAFFGVAVKIPVNYVLIYNQYINIVGAVISTILCYVVASAINMYFLYRRTRILPSLSGALVKPVMAATGMGMVCYVVYYTLIIFVGNAVSTIAALCAGIMAYLLFMCIIRGFCKSDLQALPLPRKVRRWMQEL